MISQAVILAGGLGTRLRPITERIPKPLVEVRGKPFLCWQLMELRRQGVNRVVLLIGYLGQMIEDYFLQNGTEGMEIVYSYEPEPLGTGGALKNALPKLDEKFWLLNGDSFLRAPLKDMAVKFEDLQFDALVSTFSRLKDVPVPANLKVSGDFVLEYKKGGGAEAGFTHIDSGVYVINRKVIENYNGGSKYNLEQAWPEIIKNKRLGAFNVDERFYDIGTPERLKVFEERLGDYFKNSI